MGLSVHVLLLPQLLAALYAARLVNIATLANVHLTCCLDMHRAMHAGPRHRPQLGSHQQAADGADAQRSTLCADRSHMSWQQLHVILCHSASGILCGGALALSNSRAMMASQSRAEAGCTGQAAALQLYY
jgi:hypothetical protein